MINEYLKNNYLITDGAMGTYYAEITGDSTAFCEFANIKNPEIIKRIHKEYIDAGAKMIRTNTFSANSITLQIGRDETKEIIKNGYGIAKEVSKGREVFIAASIGPMHESVTEKDNINILDEYKFVVDSFFEEGANIFVFETFSSVDYIEEISAYIKNKDKKAFILVQFALTPDGFTRSGVSVQRVVSDVESIKNIDAFGFNCGSGPAHLYNLINKINLDHKIISVLPNSGYSDIINQRTVYVNNPDYFADKMIDIKNLGVKILGGCCGTTPEHIKKLTEKINISVMKEKVDNISQNVESEIKKKQANEFYEKLKRDEFVVAVELDPPFDTNIDKIMRGAKICKDKGIDLITVADSPMSKVRVDSIMIASKIKREIGIDAMPHICCRDKNQNAIRSGLLAAHIEGIRNVLAVTGDPISDNSSFGAKSVFNLNSFRLMELISQMNEDVFNNDGISIGGALNLNVLNKDVQLKRMFKKAENGATFFLTQPIFDDEVIEFLSKIKKGKNIKILAGIMPLVSYRNAQFLNNEVPGITIPDEYIARFREDMSKEEAEETGIELAVEIGKKVKEFADGLYMITPFNRVEMVLKVLERIEKN